MRFINQKVKDERIIKVIFWCIYTKHECVFNIVWQKFNQYGKLRKSNSYVCYTGKTNIKAKIKN